MGRSRKSDGFDVEAFFELLLIAPIWFGPIIAFVVFAFLYWLIPSLGTPSGPDYDGAKVISVMVVGMSTAAAPYVAGVVLLLWAIAEATKWFKRDSRSSITRMFEEAEDEQSRQGEHATQGTSAHDSAPSCPRCSATMTLRTAKRGANTGSQFWGCPNYPRCKGTRDL